MEENRNVMGTMQLILATARILCDNHGVYSCVTLQYQTTSVATQQTALISLCCSHLPLQVTFAFSTKN